jgi:hypothetical protein
MSPLVRWQNGNRFQSGFRVLFSGVKAEFLLIDKIVQLLFILMLGLYIGI